MPVAICTRCRTLFDPALAPVRFGEKLLCSWHPGQPENIGNTGPRGDYAELWKWSCCGKTEVAPIVEQPWQGSTAHVDHPPLRSPGCTSGPHEADESLELAESLATGIQALQNRLQELSEFEVRGVNGSEVFISYSHKDSAFVDRLSERLISDSVAIWRDERDILVGDVIDRAISDGIQKNSMFLVVLTPNSISSSWVQREIDEAAHEAAEGHKIVLPIVTNGLSPLDVPARLRRLKCAEFGADFESAYGLLWRSIHAHLKRNRS